MSYRLELEMLENRMTPSTLHWIGAVDSDYTNRLNWTDETGICPLDYPDSAEDIIIFDNISNISGNSGQYCLLSNVSVTVGGVMATSDFVGTLALDNATLHIANVGNPASEWDGGQIIAVDTSNPGMELPSEIDVDGGTFMYNVSSLNSGSATNTIDVYIYNGATAQFAGVFTTQGATMHVGVTGESDESPGSPSTGTLIYDSTQPIYIETGNSIKVSTGGFVEFGSGVSVESVSLTSYGSVQLDINTTVSMAPGETLNIFGGFLVGPNTTSSSVATINGDVSLDNATLKMGTSTGVYSSLFIFGDLTLINSVYQVDVDASSLVQCDSVVADNIHIDDSDTLAVFTSNPTAVGPHQYRVMFSRNGDGITGEFGQYQWLGDNPVVWTTEYDHNVGGDSLLLTLKVAGGGGFK